MVVKQRNNNCFVNRKRHIHGRDVCRVIYRALVAQTPLMVAGHGVAPELRIMSPL